jgi:aminotransferase
MIKLSDLTLTTPPSGIRAVFNRIAESEDVISLALGEPDSHTSERFIEAAVKSMYSGRTHYTPNAGLMDLRRAIAESYGNRCILPEQVIVTAGGTEALLLIFMTLLNPGDEVVVMEPYWPTYLGQIRTVGAVPRFVRVYEEDGFVVRKENLNQAVNEKTRIILLNSPANPTGAVIHKETMEFIAKLAEERDLTVISDEVYRRMIYEEETYTSIYDVPGMEERCLIVDSFSKTYAMTGWRIGYIIAPVHVAKALETMHEYSVSCISEPTQRAAIAALKYGEDFVRESLDSLKRQRDRIVEGLSGVPGLRCRKPEATFYLYFNIEDTGMRAEEFVYGLLEQEKLALAPGTAFGEGQESYIRLSFANAEETLDIAAERIRRFVHQNCRCAERREGEAHI